MSYITVDDIAFQSVITSEGLDNRFLAITDGLSDGSKDINVNLNICATCHLGETTTPTPIADTGALYTKSDNVLYFQDGSGVEHIVTLS